MLGYRYDDVVTHLSILIFVRVLAGSLSRLRSTPSGYSCELGFYGPMATCLVGGDPGRPVGWDFGCLGQVVIDYRRPVGFCDRPDHVGRGHRDCSLDLGSVYGIGCT